VDKEARVRTRWFIAVLAAVAAVMAAPVSATASGAARDATATPIKHVVVIFDENISFDHYFGTYPFAANPPGEPRFHAAPGTPTVNGLTSALLTANTNLANPFRFDRSEPITCDQNHDYTPEQQSMDAGLMDKFVQFDGSAYTPPPMGSTRPCRTSDVMGYYDGNTVTALWNYAQHFALEDESFGTTFGPSTPGAINLVSGQTHGVTPANRSGDTSNGTIIGDPDPRFDDCSSGSTAAMHGTNIGDLLNGAGLTWGWFEGGFKPSSHKDGKAVCDTAHKNIGGALITDYEPHHEPFQYYRSTANPHHLPPTSTAMIGRTDRANHQYDVSDFWAAVDHGNMPAVSFLKARASQDGHADNSDPLDEQHWLVSTINRIERLPTWRSTAIVIAWDDSDGWYDHVMPPIVSQSNDPGEDALTAPGHCGTAAPGAYQDRCGYGPRLPLLVVSPWARRNSVDSQITDQTSIIRFVEDNWSLGRIGNQSFDAKAGPLDGMFDFSGPPHTARLILNPITGEVVHH
jgi:phospholipase C